MALPSQTDHSASSSSRTFVYKRRPRTSRLAVFGLVTVLAGTGAGAIYLFNRYASPAPASAKEPAGPANAEPARATPSLPPAAVTEPETIRQGGPLSKGLELAKSEQSASPPKTDPSPEAAKPAPVDLNKPGEAPASLKAPSESPATSATPPAVPATASVNAVKELMSDAEKKFAAGDPVSARVLYSKALLDPRAVKADQEAIRAKLTTINDDILFSTKITKGDPFCEEYVVQSGDSPIKIARKRDLDTGPGLIERINKIDPRKLQVGQKLKLVRGPFHAVVSKAEYRLDLYGGSPDDPKTWVYIRSFKVGLGEGNGTPLGVFVVKPKSKLVNPHWVNPRTGEKFDADDPANPIGERWIGIEGIGPSAVHTGFGIHGTIDPSSIGQQKSMGCVRMATDDVSLIYDLLTEKVSMVKIEP